MSTMYRRRNVSRVRRNTKRISLRGAVGLPAAALFGALVTLLLLPAGRGAAIPRVDTSLGEEAETVLDLVPPSPSPKAEEENIVRLGSSKLTVSVDGVPTELELEEYLIGVVAGEMPVSSEPAALAAQAIAARTFTALHMAGGARCRSGCTVCSDPGCCQAYISAAELKEKWGADYEKNIARIRRAVEETEGLVAVYEGRLISALYHASSGAATESSEAVFAMALPYLVSVDSREGASGQVSVQEFSEAELVKKLAEAFPEAGLETALSPSDLDVWGRTESGRVQLIRVGDTVVTGTQLRMALGLKSAAFTVERVGGKVIFTCTGFGHGVGMSQTGANEMAKAGAGFEEIIKHFYTGTELAKLEFGGGAA